MAYIFWEVSRRPDIQLRLHAELDQAMPNSRAIPDISTLYKLPFLTAVVKEGFPPLPCSYKLNLTKFGSISSLRRCPQPSGARGARNYQYDER